jgi:hypothetical protein
MNPIEQRAAMHDHVIQRLEPWSAACINIFESSVRLATDTQLKLARSVAYAPAQAAMSATADLTRDVGAAYASCARWLLKA